QTRRCLAGCKRKGRQGRNARRAAPGKRKRQHPNGCCLRVHALSKAYSPAVNQRRSCNWMSNSQGASASSSQLNCNCTPRSCRGSTASSGRTPVYSAHVNLTEVKPSTVMPASASCGLAQSLHLVSSQAKAHELLSSSIG